MSASKSPKSFSMLIATVFGLGYSPVAPGTVGSVAAVVLYYLLFDGLPPLTYMLMWLILFEVACYVAQMASKALHQDDPQVVVIDEVVGYLIAMFMLPTSPGYVVAAFVLFRFFDVLKPFPASYFDQKVRNGFGVVMDDVAAGLFANLAIQLGRLILS